MSKIFVLHGWTYQTESWQPLLKELRARGFDPEFLRVPGLTDGSNPVWSLHDYVEWLRQAAASHGKVILIGHSNGGRISLAFAAKYPEKVERLILEDSAGIPPRGLRRLKRDAFRALSSLARLLPVPEEAKDMFYKLIRESDYRKATPEMRRTMANLVAADLAPSLPRIEAPTLIIWGGRDKTTPLSDGLLMHEKIRGSRIFVLPEARHSPHITHTKKVADLIVEELQRA